MLKKWFNSPNRLWNSSPKSVNIHMQSTELKNSEFTQPQDLDGTQVDLGYHSNKGKVKPKLNPLDMSNESQQNTMYKNPISLTVHQAKVRAKMQYKERQVMDQAMLASKKLAEQKEKEKGPKHLQVDEVRNRTNTNDNIYLVQEASKLKVKEKKKFKASLATILENEIQKTVSLENDVLNDMEQDIQNDPQNKLKAHARAQRGTVDNGVAVTKGGPDDEQEAQIEAQHRDSIDDEYDKTPGGPGVSKEKYEAKMMKKISPYIDDLNR